MQKILIIAIHTFLYRFRQRREWGTLLLVTLCVVFFFSIARGDGRLENELSIRWMYSMYIASFLWSLVLLVFSCEIVRGEMDKKYLHFLTIYPISRYQIYLGKWLGCMIYGVVGIIFILGIEGICIGYLFYQAPIEEQTRFKNQFSFLWYYAIAYDPKPEEVVDEEIRQLIRENRVPRNISIDKLRTIYMEEVRKKQRIILPNGSRSWRIPVESTYGIKKVELNFFAHTRERIPIEMEWMMYNQEGVVLWQSHLEWKPPSLLQIPIPRDVLESNDLVFIRLNVKKNSELYVPPETGMRLKIYTVPWWYNGISWLGVTVVYMGILIGWGMLWGTLLTMSVALFTSIACYLATWLNPLFSYTLTEIEEGLVGNLYTFGKISLRIGLSLFSYLEYPDVIGSLAKGQHVTLSVLPHLFSHVPGYWIVRPVYWVNPEWGEWLTKQGYGLMSGWIGCGIAILVCGMFCFQRKELDRLH